MLTKINIQMWDSLIQVLLILNKRDLISKLKSAIVFTPFLNGIICQMYDFVECFSAVFAPRRSQISLIIIIRFQMPISGTYNRKASNIKLPIFIQRRRFYIPLQNKCPLRTISLTYNLSNIRTLCLNRYSYTSISIFSRFHNPNIFKLLYLLGLVQFMLYFS